MYSKLLHKRAWYSLGYAYTRNKKPGAGMKDQPVECAQEVKTVSRSFWEWLFLNIPHLPLQMKVCSIPLAE